MNDEQVVKCAFCGRKFVLQEDGAEMCEACFNRVQDAWYV